MHNNKVVEWTETSREMVFQKFSRKIEKVMFNLPDGSESDIYVKAEGVTVCILALTETKEIVMVKQFRPGPKKYCLNYPVDLLELMKSLLILQKKNF